MRISDVSDVFCFFKKEKYLKLYTGTEEVAQWVGILAVQTRESEFQPSALISKPGMFTCVCNHQ